MLLTGQYIFEDFKQILYCLGPLTDAEWMGCTSLPGYSTFRVAELSAQVAGNDMSVQAFFSSDRYVKYPKPPEDSGLALIKMLLKWSPRARCTARQALDHEFCGFQPDQHEIAEAIRQCTFEELGKLVFDSITGSVPVPVTALMCGSNLGRFKRNRECEDEHGSGGECVSEAACRRARTESELRAYDSDDSEGALSAGSQNRPAGSPAGSAATQVVELPSANGSDSTPDPPSSRDLKQVVPISEDTLMLVCSSIRLCVRVEALAEARRVTTRSTGSPTAREIAWPDSNEPTSVRTFADALVRCVQEGLQIAKEHEDRRSYSAVSIARKVLVFSSELIPDIFDKCHMTDILKWTADEAGHLDVLKVMRGLAVREAFGLQPVMIAVWTLSLIHI